MSSIISMEFGYQVTNFSYRNTYKICLFFRTSIMIAPGPAETLDTSTWMMASILTPWTTTASRFLYLCLLLFLPYIVLANTGSFIFMRFDRYLSWKRLGKKGFLGTLDLKEKNYMNYQCFILASLKLLQVIFVTSMNKLDLFRTVKSSPAHNVPTKISGCSPCLTLRTTGLAPTLFILIGDSLAACWMVVSCKYFHMISVILL